MFKKSVFGFLLYSFIVSSAFSISASRQIFNFKSLPQEIAPNFSTTGYETVSQPSLINNTAENEILFWTTSDGNLGSDSEPEMKTETEPVTEAENLTNLTEFNRITENLTEKPNAQHENVDFLINDTPTNEKPTKTDQINNENKNDDPLIGALDVFDFTTDEKIVLHRNNCNMEIPVQENEDFKIKIEFQKLENNTSGKCCITLNGQMNNLIGIVISNIQLYQNGSQGEVIKVITADYGSNFVLKEYYSWSKYQPLLLTETNKVYIVLHYEVKSVPQNEKNSHFNLEVFSYQKYEVFGNIHHQSQFSNKNGAKNLSNTEPPFFSYYYYE